MVAVCALVLSNLCVPAAYAPVSEGVGVTTTRPAAAADIRRMGVHVRVFTTSVTGSAPAASLKKVCAGRVCILYRSSCAPGGLSCTYEEWPIARAAVRSATYVPLQRIRIDAATVQTRRTAEVNLQILVQEKRGRTFVPLARLAPKT